MTLLTLRAWWKEFVRNNIVAEDPTEPRPFVIPGTSSRHVYRRSSKSGLAILGALLIVLPWILFSLGGWGVCLYLLLGFAFTVIMVCLNWKHRKRRL